MIEENEVLEELRRARPLHNSWLKKDFLSQEECVYVFYDIEPFTQEEKMRLGILNQEWKFIQSFDVMRLFDILKDSCLVLCHQGTIPMEEFENFLKAKEILPKHVLTQEKPVNPLSSDSCDEMHLSIPELKRRFVRTWAAYFWKTAEGNDASMSAIDLAKNNTFQGALSYFDMKVEDPKKFSEKFSDLGPRSHKRKKKSK